MKNKWIIRRRLEGFETNDFEWFIEELNKLKDKLKGSKVVVLELANEDHLTKEELLEII
jgi:hypothetical protein